MILIYNKEGLIGDFLGTIPAMQKLAENDCVLLKYNKEVKGLYELILSDKIKEEKQVEIDDVKNITFNSSEAFQIAHQKGYYMTQAFMAQAGLEVPEVPPKAKLSFKEEYLSKDYYEIDYLVSPYARSLPPEQKWQDEKWTELFETLPDKKFGVLGNSKYDKYIWNSHKNVVPLFDMDFGTLCLIYKYSKLLISVVTGTSHLAFHLNTKNILLTNQNMTWGNNPDAIKITDYIPNITVKQVIEKL